MYCSQWIIFQYSTNDAPVCFESIFLTFNKKNKDAPYEKWRYCIFDIVFNRISERLKMNTCRWTRYPMPLWGFLLPHLLRKWIFLLVFNGLPNSGNISFKWKVTHLIFCMHC